MSGLRQQKAYGKWLIFSRITMSAAAHILARYTDENAAREHLESIR